MRHVKYNLDISNIIILLLYYYINIINHL